MEKLYFAPMEGVTGYVYRNAYHKYINNTIDKYYTPFISPNQNTLMTNREKNDVLPENNHGIPVVPQILSKDATLFVETAKELKEMGYQEVNLNLGCPSRTVVTKGKGAGMLQDLDNLKRFLDEIFEKTPMEISIKTRMGMEREEEMEPLLTLYNTYPVKEIILHARLLEDYYSGEPRREAYKRAKEISKHPLCYNGDINTVEDYEKLPESHIMVGRGCLRRPELSLELQGKEEKGDFWSFHQALLEGYIKEMSGETPVLFKMKELWGYMGSSFLNAEKIMKQIKKAKKIKDYQNAVNQLKTMREV